MIDDRQTLEILQQYNKHGWILRRVLLAKENKLDFPDSLKDVFSNAEIVSSDFDALWFSRGAANGNETWELRRLSSSPFALVEVFENDDDEEGREERRKEMETRMSRLASKSLNRKPDN